MATLGDRIKYYRKLKGLTQPELAAKTGVGFSAISKWESNTTTNLPIERLQRIADALDVTTGVLLGIEPDLVNGSVTDPQKEIVARLPYLSWAQQELILRLIQEFR